MSTRGEVTRHHWLNIWIVSLVGLTYDLRTLWSSEVSAKIKTLPQERNSLRWEARYHTATKKVTASFLYAYCTHEHLQLKIFVPFSSHLLKSVLRLSAAQFRSTEETCNTQTTRKHLSVGDRNPYYWDKHLHIIQTGNTRVVVGCMGSSSWVPTTFLKFYGSMQYYSLVINFSWVTYNRKLGLWLLILLVVLSLNACSSVNMLWSMSCNVACIYNRAC